MNTTHNTYVYQLVSSQFAIYYIFNLLCAIGYVLCT